MLIATQGKIVNIGSVAALVPYPFASIYNASKAALLSYGDTLRIEMKPFGVQVISVVSGVVKTNIFRNDEYDIKPGSLYYPMRDLYLSKRPGSSESILSVMAAEDYAKYVVSRTIQARPPLWIWRGSYAFTTWIASFMPTGFTDTMVSQQLGLDIFKKRLAETKKKD